MNKITDYKRIQMITEMVPHTNFEGPTGKIFTWIETQLILLLVSAWLIVGIALLVCLHVLKWLTDLFVKGILKLMSLLQKRDELKAPLSEEKDPTYFNNQNINLN